VWGPWGTLPDNRTIRTDPFPIFYSARVPFRSFPHIFHFSADPMQSRVVGCLPIKGLCRLTQDLGQRHSAVARCDSKYARWRDFVAQMPENPTNVPETGPLPPILPPETTRRTSRCRPEGSFMLSYSPSTQLTIHRNPRSWRLSGTRGTTDCIPGLLDRPQDPLSPQDPLEPGRDSASPFGHLLEKRRRRPGRRGRKCLAALPRCEDTLAYDTERRECRSNDLSTI
jgi:hypothetical protein